MCNKVFYDIRTDRFYYNKKEAGRITPITLCYHIGYDCNLDCDYCLSKNSISQSVSTDLLDYIEYIKKWKPLRLVVSGGEPLLYIDKLVAILKELKRNGINTFLSTNGILVKKEYSKLRGLVDWYDISLPAVNRKTYVAVRGRDEFDNILEGIDLLVSSQERVRLTFTINEWNQKEVLDFPGFAITHGIDNIRIGHTFSYIDSTLNEELWKAEYTDEILIYGDRLKIYLPLSESQLSLYNEGYILLENDGSVYRNMVRNENYICHISEVEQYTDVFSKIGELQIKLFGGEL